jgi:phage anti-repressor protein
MENFLKQFSTIPHNFITDFFIIAKEEYTDNEIIINFDLVSKWLNIRKDNLKKILINNFEEKFDYAIETIKKKHPNTNRISNYDEILITPNCLKELCMISQTSKAKEVRKYFIEMEKLIKRYFETIKEEMYKKIGLLETNQKSKTNIIGGIIYILKALNSDVTLYKLGKSKNLKNRLNTYNSGNANDVEPLFILPVNDIDSVETCVKKACKKFQYRKYKEVYEIDVDVLKEVMSECNDFVNKMAFKLKDKDEKKKFKSKISRMKKKIDKYFIYLSKNNDLLELDDNILDV